MASREEVIRRIRTVFTQEGAEGVARAYSLVADGEEKVTRNSLSLNRAFENLERRYNKDIALQQQYAKHQEQINAAVAQNPALQTRAADTLARMDEQFKKTNIANDNFVKGTKASRYELINLSRQVQDVVVSLSSGQSLGTVLLQQGTQIGDVFASSSLGARGLLSHIKSLITPTVLLVAGLAGLVTAGVAATLMWQKYALALDDAAKASGIAVSDLSRLQSAAGVKGLSESEFTTGIVKFAQGVNEAKTNAGELYKLFRLNGLAIGDAEQSLVNVAELIKRSGDEQQKLRLLQQAGLPATAQWVRYLEDGKEGIEKAKKAAEEFGGLTNSEMVMKARQFQEAWDKAWVDFGVSLRRSVYEGYDLIQRLIGKGREAVGAFDKATGGRGLITVGENLLKSGFGEPLSQNVDRLYGGFDAAGGPREVAPGKKVVDTQAYAAEQQQLQFLQQRNGLLGQAATVEQLVAAKQQEVNSAQILNNQITPEMAKNIVNLYRAQEEYARAAESVSALGAAATDAERYAVAVQGLSIKLAEGRLSQENFNRAVAAAHPLFEPLKAAGNDFATSFATGMAKGGKLIDVLRDSIANLEQQLIRLATSKIFEQLFGAVTGTGPAGGGFLPFLFNANGNAFDRGNVIPFARGGIVDQPTIFPMENGVGLMGEAGPEGVLPLRRGSDGRLGVIASGAGQSITIAPTIQVTMPAGAKPEDGRAFGEEALKPIVAIVRAEVNKYIVAQKRGGGMLAA